MTFSITGAHCECLAEGCRAMALYAEIERLKKENEELKAKLRALGHDEC